ncbi:MAG TPA: TIR domain-containing protein [Roseiflexaceae bacterium]|nr:TIR domain-containing protein [Roseiflexaceae bacterium]
MTTDTAAATHDLFISYAEADRAWVNNFLADALEEAGVKIHSEDAFALGVPRLVEFERAIKQSTRTLLILSPAYLADTFGQFVDVLVNSYGMETATWPVIPLTLQEVDLPPRLSQLVRLDASTPESQQRALEKLCAEMKRPVPGPAPLPACPYPGMVPFDEADSARFFGREQEVQELVERLRLHPFLAVIGASGSGKSSLVRAGLIPALRKGHSRGGDWVIRTMRPGDAPLGTLGAALTDLPRARQLGAANESQAASGDLALPEGVRLLLLVDQFEESFTVAGAEAQTFQQELARITAIPSCNVVLTVRADFYADLMTSPLWGAIQAHRFEVTPLDEDALRQAIVRPAEQVGVAVEAALVERLVADAAGEPGVLPLIQETMVLLWERLERRFLPMRAYEALVLTRDSYGGKIDEERSGLQVAIARRADATLAGLSAAQQTIARRIFLRLIQFGEGRADTRRQQPLAALQSVGDDPALFDQTIKQLAENRLITLSGAELKDRGPKTKDQSFTAGNSLPSSLVLRPWSPNVDISHEALIRGWPALQGWLTERREGEQTRRRLEGKAQEWARLGRETGGLLDAVEVLEAERWLASDDAAEMGFDAALPELVERSQAAIAAAEQEKETARQRELVQAQALAEEQRQRAEEQAAASKRLRRRALFLAGAAGVAVLAMIAALVFLQQSQRSEQRAQQNAAEALSQKNIADQQRTIADQKRTEADTNAAEARRQEQLAKDNATLAEQRAIDARVSELAAQANLAADRFPQRSLLLAAEALNLSSRDGAPASPVAVDSLRAGLAQIGGQVLTSAAEPASTLAYSADGRYVAIGSANGPVRVLDTRAAEPNAAPIALRGHEAEVLTLAFSPDGRHLASGSADSTIRLWDLSASSAADPLILRGQRAEVIKLAFSPDGRYLASGGADSAVLLWDVADSAATADPIELSGHEGQVVAVVFSPDGRSLASGSVDGSVRIWNLQSNDPAADPIILQGNGELINAVAFSPDGRSLAAGGGEQVFGVWLWDLGRASPSASRKELKGHLGTITSLLFSSQGRTLISSSRDRTVRLWNLAEANPSAKPTILRGHADEIRTTALSPDGTTLATGSGDNTVRLWNLTSVDPNGSVRVLKGHDAPVIGLAFSPDGHLLVSASDDATARLWHLAGRDGITLQDGSGRITGVAYSPDGQTMATSDYDGFTRIWDLRPGATKPVVVLPQGAGSANAVAFSPDGRTLASALDDSPVQLWNIQEPDFAARPTELSGPKAGVLALTWSPDGRYLAGSSRDQNDPSIWVWDLQAADPSANPRTLQGHSDLVLDLAWSKDGQTLASASFDHSVLLWNMRDAGQQPKALLGHSNAVVAVAFSPDGHTLASGSWDTTARLWDLSAADPSADPIVLNDHTNTVVAVAFSPDGRHLTTGGYDNTARLWDLSAADVAASGSVLTRDSSAITRVAFSPDGSTLATGDAASAVRLWPLDLPNLIEQACGAAGRNLNMEEWQLFYRQADYHTTCTRLPPHASYLDTLIGKSSAVAREGKIAEAVAGFAEARRLDPAYQIGARAWNTLCRAGVLSGQVTAVLEACGSAVAQAPSDGDYHDSRGLARALIGDPAGAIEDFAAYAAWAQAQDPEANKAAIDLRQQWIADLKAGRQPLDAEALTALREAELGR